MKTSTYTHYYLYAKNWYEKSGNLIEDLKKVHGYTFDYDPDFADVDDIVHTLLKLVWYHCLDKDTATSGPRCEDAFQELINDIAQGQNWKVGYDPKTPYVYEEAVIRKCLSMLRLLAVKDKEGRDILFLDPPSEKVLPLRKHETVA